MLIPLDHLIRKHKLNITGILHIGACRLEELADYKRLGINKVYWVEANEQIVSEMKIKYPDEQIYNVCLGSKDNEVRSFMLTNNEHSSSLLEFGTHATEHTHVIESGRINIETLTLDTFTRTELPGREYNMINIDIQGMELAVLKQGVETLKNVSYIYAEVNEKELYKECGLLPELDTFLESQGFIRIETKMLSHGWGDSLYCKIN